ncbi:LysR family transcriptional regulator [Lysinibacillus sp. OL1_EC]|uniref:LysR family transcriptional regulator n=1 Tax=unclassified Lysinibacillus TaxID=2636778 RepID=UPI0010395073|nr:MULTISPECIES: LysR family transcriptional regulator [unclassified Lysinibacillus]MCM0623621.1 LysR family transcriptional regulator [Lysinibacillus sp. OL1_EC]MCS5500397.1 LysR family transcriptional regulator [Lysinibacillus sp. A4]TBV89475.1 LysR family transcriptional regulator [Lysinibacillus sp. OL1]UKJ46607.1 LysR family transcriptional regulator [Lysinibacillus sp. ACHW1.5]
MNLHALRLFTKVAELNSVSKAAQTLMISQPAVTIQIRNLEKELGLTLLEAKGRGISLTQNGTFLYKQAQRLFDLESDIENKVEQLKNTGNEELQIASTHVPSHFLLPKWLAQFKQVYPATHIHLKTANSQQVIEDLLHYKADLAFIVKEDGHHADINYQFLMNLDYWFIVPYNHHLAGQTVSLAELMQQPFVTREDGSSTKEYLNALCKVHKIPPPKVGLQLDGINESIHAIAAGFGTMLAPSIAASSFILQQQVARVFIKDIDIQRPIYLCTRKNELHHSTSFNNFLHIINESII